MQSDSGKPSDVVRIEIAGEGEPPASMPRMTADELDSLGLRHQWLADRGPVIQIIVLSGDGSRSAVGKAVIDTGGQRTFIDQGIVESLGLVKCGNGVIDVQLPGEKMKKCHTFDGLLRFPNCQTIRRELAALPIVVEGMDTIAIIGRDILQYGRLVYDGESGRFSASLDMPVRFIVE